VFQSTRPRGARRKSVEQVQALVTVSIHAPARGATRLLRFCSRAEASFNPRARAGRDSSTFMYGKLLDSFNPRARAGRDKEKEHEVQTKQVSIHAPARGATCFCTTFLCSSFCFNPRARAGRDP